MENIVRRRPQPDPATPDARILRCAFTGYRPQKLPWGYDEADPSCANFKQRLRETIELLIFQGYTHFLSGGALGVDTYAAEIVLDLRKQYPWIALEMALPFEAQASSWPKASQARYYAILDEADIITYTSHQYSRSCMFVRNRYLVDNADLLVAGYDGQPGGTQMTCEYARECGIEGCLVRPVVERLAVCA